MLPTLDLHPLLPRVYELHIGSVMGGGSGSVVMMMMSMTQRYGTLRLATTHLTARMVTENKARGLSSLS